VTTSRDGVAHAGPAEPWRGLPSSIADVIEPELDAVTNEILATIAQEVPEYARPLEGSFGRGVRTGVTEALRQFVALVRDPDAGRAPGREVYVALGGGELRQGRTLDSLQSAYRVGARVAWRRLAAAARREGVTPEMLSLLAESIFAYIEELSADSVEGYAEARSQLEGERRRRRRELVTLMLREPPVDGADLRAAADAAGWRVPRALAPLAVPEDDLARLLRRLPQDSLATTVDGAGCVIVPDPDGPSRAAELESAAGTVRAVLGPATDPRGLAASWALALSLLHAGQENRLVRVDDSLTELLLREGRELVNRMGVRRLAPLDALTPRARQRMEDTALAYVREQGNAAAMARALEIHPQTARYRLARLRELVGDELDDPDARLELELALRARAVASAGA
jgi:hypothetical protein